MTAPTHQSETNHAHHSFQKQSQLALCENQYLTVMHCCQERSKTEQVQTQNLRLQVETGFRPCICPIKDYGHIAEPSRVRREELNNMSFN